MLEDLGLFIGKSKDRNNEALFFIDLNMWLLEQSSGGLENPKSIRYILEDREVRTLFADFIRHTMKTPKVISYLGFKKYLTCRTPLNLNIPWGWKDPRNTFTLPFAPGFELYGLDYSHEMIRLAQTYARKFNFQANLMVADAGYLPFASETFDRVISVAAYHHLRYPRERRAAFHELWRSFHHRLEPLATPFLVPWQGNHGSMAQRRYCLATLSLPVFLPGTGE